MGVQCYCAYAYAIKLAKMEKKIGMVRSLSSELDVSVASFAGDESGMTASFGTEGAIGTSLVSPGGGASVSGTMLSIMGASPAAGICSSGAGAGVGPVCVKPTTQ
jgi:hypothetical protein